MSPRQVAVERAAHAVDGAIDGDVKIGLSVLDEQGRGALEAHLDTATLVLSAARAIHIGKAHDNACDDVSAMIQAVGEARADVFAQSVGQGEVVRLDLQVHGIRLSGRQEHTSIMDKVNVRHKQINS